MAKTGSGLGSDYELGAKYVRSDAPSYFTGVQAIVRVVLDQLRRDADASLRTAAFVSGYPGSPLAGLDIELARTGEVATELGVRHVPGHNEELAATAVWGSQVAQALDDPTHDGVLGVWYGKAPGLDRAKDAIRHAQYVGTARNGGVVAFVGDDPACKSSSIPGSSAHALRDLGLPTLFPGDVRDVLALGPHAVAMSRLSGLWTGVSIVTVVADGTQTVTVPSGPAEITVPQVEWQGRPFVPTLNTIPCPPWSIAVEEELVGPRVDVAREYGYLNGLNPVTAPAEDAWLGVVAVGNQHAELVSALEKLGLTLDDASQLGVRVLHVRQPHPLDPRTIREFGRGLTEIFVIEEKRPFLEEIVRQALYGTADQPLVVGKQDEHGRTLLPRHGALDADTIHPRLRARLLQRVGEDRLRPTRSARVALPIIGAKRAPYFCSGCPHNVSTRVPDGALVGGGIGCHSMAQFMEPEITGVTASMTHMGAEGAQWIGIEPFVRSDHMFQNVGDGTFFHSGQLAVQAAVAAGSHITFKLLYNDAIAMTGGQDTSESNALPVPDVAEVLLRQGVARVLVTTDDRSRYRRVKLPSGVEVWDRTRLIEAQEALREVPGVTVLIHDQRCAAEVRRDRKRKRVPTPPQRIFINERVCEGCGDCGAKSNCLSVQPIDTDYGRKTQIDQDSCNLDMTCLQGDCPSFVKVTVPDDRTATKAAHRRPAALTSLLASDPPDVTPTDVGSRYAIRMPGIGGTGVVTASQILGTAALMDGLQTAGLDQTGLSQKAGPVISDLVLSDVPTGGANKVTKGSVDLVLGFDLLVAGGEDTVASMVPGRTRAVVSTAQTPTGAMVSDVRQSWPDDVRFKAELEDRLGPHDVLWVDADAVTGELLGSSAGSNIFLIGVSFQWGRLPISAASIERAIELNGVAVTANLDAFRLGRWWVARRAEVEALLGPRSLADTTPPPSFDLSGRSILPGAAELVAGRAADLVAYQDASYAERFVRSIEKVSAAEDRVRPGSHALTEAFARSLHKLMAYKDEYEVARLSLDPAVEADIRAQFGDGVKISYQLHPPILRALGMDRKMSLGPWFTPAFRVLARMKRLRGTRLDPFGATSMRRLERELVVEFEDVVDRVAGGLRGDNLDLAAEIAGLPDLVRGYEDVKLGTVIPYRERLATSMQAFTTAVDVVR